MSKYLLLTVILIPVVMSVFGYGYIYIDVGINV